MTAAAASEGTPAYLAPEVLAGQPPTARSDIYSLGIVLYQVVVGDLRRALAPGWEQDVSDELLREDIALAAAGNPAQRLSDAGQLAHRLRHIHDRRRERDAQRLRDARAAEAHRQIERARARRGLVIALGFTLSAALIVTLLLLWNARQARIEARAEAARASAISAFVTEDLLSAANPEIVGRRDISVREVLDGARSRIPQRFAADARIAATLKGVIGNAYAALGDRQNAEPLLLEAERSLADTAGPAAPETQAARMQLRQLYLAWNDIESSEAALQRAVDAEAAAGNPNPEIGMEAENQRNLLECWSRYPSIYVARCTDVADAGLSRARARFGAASRATYSAMLDAADARLKLGQGGPATPLFRDALEGYRRDFPADLYWTLLAELLLYQALVLDDHAADTVVGLKRLAERVQLIYGPEIRIVYTARRWYATALRHTGRAQDSLALLDELRESWLKARTGRPHDYAWIELERARSLSALNRPSEAGSALSDGLAVMAPVERPSGYWTTLLREQQADLLLADGRIADAEALLQLNLDQCRTFMLHGEWLLGWAAFRLGTLHASSGHIDRARPLLEEAVQRLDGHLGSDDPRSRSAQEALDRLNSPTASEQS
jgi:non-specific serine/threonine protein kinase